MADFYDVLGVNRDATADDIKKAYRQLTRKHHPDVSSDSDAHSRMAEINEAFETLGDNAKRHQYDNGGFETSGSWPSRPPTPPFRQNTPLFHTIYVTLEEALQPMKKRVQMKRQRFCSECEGFGTTEPKTCDICRGFGIIIQDTITQTPHGTFRMQQQAVCEACQQHGYTKGNICGGCHGFGLISEDVQFDIDIPLGNTENQFTLGPLGNHENPQGPPGPLVINVRLSPHAFFDVDSRKNLHMVQDIDPVMSILGGDLQVKSLRGEEIVIKVSRGSVAEQVFVVSGEGLPSSETETGNLYVKLNPKAPGALTEEQEECLQRYMALRKEK